jgi:phenylacetate-coenzyme A ligase PaaK-like adenylate-forming protein
MAPNDLHAAVDAIVRPGMPAHIERLTWSAEQIRAQQEAGLGRLLAHAVERSPFHARRLAGIDLASVRPDDLGALPVMTKAQMMDAYDEVLTVRSLSRARLEAALATTTTEPVAVDGRYVALASGGSSGLRGMYAYDAPGLAELQMALGRSMFARVAAMGGAAAGSITVGMVAAGSALHATRAISRLLASDVPFRFVSVPATLPLPEAVASLNDLQPAVLYGYPSALVRLAEEQAAGRLRVTPFAITSTSETLRPEVRARLTEVFGVEPSDTFGSSEGLVGIAPPGDPILSFNDDQCIVELVDEHDEPVPPGTPSTRVLVTNLTNLVQPLIRYALDDVFVAQPPSPDHGHLRALVWGRCDTVLRFGDVQVHPLAVRSALLAHAEVLDHQARQTADGLDVDVVLAGSVDLGELAQAVRTALSDAGLVDPQVRVRQVDQLDLVRATGKGRRLIPLPA